MQVVITNLLKSNDVKHGIAFGVVLAHAVKGAQTHVLNSLIKRLMHLWEPGSNPVPQPHLYSVCACHAQWAFSHPLQPAVALA